MTRTTIAKETLLFLSGGGEMSERTRSTDWSQTELGDPQVMVSVQDAGIGISEKDQEKIFKRFYRVEGANERTFPGFGIGLFIAADIIHPAQWNDRFNQRAL